MRLSSSLFVAVIALGLAASNASACNGSKGGGGFGINYGNGGIVIGNYRTKNQQCNNRGGYNGGYNDPVYGGQAYEPFHSYYVVEPGDSFYVVSLKEYGTSALAPHIARFNRLAPNSALVPGQRLQLPSVSADGRLSPSRAPAPNEGFPPVGPYPVSTPASAKFTPITETKPSAPETSTEPLPQVTPGSVLTLEGLEHGNEQGTVRLRIGGFALPVEVLEWTVNSAKVRLPKFDVPEASKAELEVVRADGTLASRNTVELTPADAKLALKK